MEYAIVGAAIIAVSFVLAVSMFGQTSRSVASIEKTISQPKTKLQLNANPEVRRFSTESQANPNDFDSPILIIATVGGASALLIAAYMVNR